jgi:hypothetical protein
MGCSGGFFVAETAGTFKQTMAKTAIATKDIKDRRIIAH